jgi:hypothetical protein
MKKIRNRIAHMSPESRRDFEGVVRTRLTYFPTGLTAGAFLQKGVQNVSPPLTYLELYLNQIDGVAARIVP